MEDCMNMMDEQMMDHGDNHGGMGGMNHDGMDPRGMPVAMIDANKDGFISREEMRRFHESMQQKREERREAREQRQNHHGETDHS